MHLFRNIVDTVLYKITSCTAYTLPDGDPLRIEIFVTLT